MLTIGQLAAYAGVTVRAVRHYHRRGLLPEPPRDASGYRRYGAEHAIALVKIRTLAQAGVPLGRVKELLAADPEGFAAALGEIDRDLRARVAALERTRARLAELRGGDRLFVTEEAVDYLDGLRALGASERAVQMERDAWILLHGVSPAKAAALLADKREAMRDPEFRAIYREYDAAFGWAADDPRLAALAARSARWMAGRPGGPAEGARGAPDPAITQLMASSAWAASPAWARLRELARRGQDGVGAGRSGGG